MEVEKVYYITYLKRAKVTIIYRLPRLKKQHGLEHQALREMRTAYVGHFRTGQIGHVGKSVILSQYVSLRV